MDLRACVPSPSTSKLLAVTALAFGLSSPAQAAWKRATQTKDGIVVDVRAEKGSSIVTVRGTWTAAKQTPKRLWKAVNDLERYTEFMPYLEVAKKTNQFARVSIDGDTLVLEGVESNGAIIDRLVLRRYAAVPSDQWQDLP